MIDTIERLEAEVQIAEDQLRAGDFRTSLTTYCEVFERRWASLGSSDRLTAADLTVLERIAELSLPFGLARQADALFDTAAQGYLRLGSRYWFDYITLKRVHLAFGSNAVLRARELLRGIDPVLGDMDGISFDRAGQQAFEASYRSSIDQQERETFFANLYLQMGRLCLALGLYTEAAQALECGLGHAGKSSPLSAQSARLPLELALGRALVERGDLNAATARIKLLRGELDQPRHIESLIRWFELSAQLAILRGEFGSAQDQLVRVWQLCLSCGFKEPALKAHLNLAQLLIVLNKTIEAKRVLAIVETEARLTGLSNIAVDAARLRLVADARAQRDSPLAGSVSSWQIGAEEDVVGTETVEALFKIESGGLSFADFQLRLLQFQYCLSSGNKVLAARSLERLRAFEGSDSRLIELALTAARATYLYFDGAVDLALPMLQETAAAYCELDMKGDQWRTQQLLAMCLGRLGREAERESLTTRNEELLAKLSGTLSIEDGIIFMLNKPTQQEEALARKIRKLQMPVSGVWAAYENMRLLNAILDDAYWQREEIARNRLQGAGAPRTHTPVPLWRRLFALGSDRATLAFIVLPDSVLIVTVSFGRLRSWVVRTARLRLRELVRRWHETVAESRPDEAAQIARHLAQELQLESVLAEVSPRVKRISILPDDVLHGFPFATLKVDGEYLIERFALTIGFQPFPRRVVRKRSVSAAPFLVGMTSGSPPLLATGPQIKWVAKWFLGRGVRTEPLFDEEANPTALLNGLQQATCFHISCHGEYTQNHPETTGWQIVTAPGKTEIVGLDQMYRLDLTDLHHATLISCWGADNFLFPGRWVLSLPEVLWRAGAGSVAASLWQVTEDCATEFVEKFYSALPGNTTDCALQVATLGMMKGAGGRPREPFDWAGFQLYGEPKKLRF
ncbi:CHAT domain-containing protein [Granulicella aggregans]|uniref:CHAT domain-containing protein n=1 Tax=Granulicella aggregans TaxID=474949 RepID=UPI0021DFE087|nr:CHAT domain-containing protein [Granulicella aggregans]